MRTPHWLRADERVFRATPGAKRLQHLLDGIAVRVEKLQTRLDGPGGKRFHSVAQRGAYRDLDASLFLLQFRLRGLQFRLREKTDAKLLPTLRFLRKPIE